jgi:hypothetical protein
MKRRPALRKSLVVTKLALIDLNKRLVHFISNEAVMK